MGTTVWVDSWQMQCCGVPFRVGSQVAWTLRAPDRDLLEQILSADSRQAVDAAEEHHGGVPEETAPTRGTVTHIAAVHCRFAPEPGSGPPVARLIPGTGILTEVWSADGWTKDRADERFVGYLVELEP